jgi:6-phosphogluconate dehydrogenase
LNIGILGLGVMGRSLALNFERNGYSVAGYDIHLNFDQAIFKDKTIRIFDALDELVTVLDKPRCILLMILAGKTVNEAISSLKPYLNKDEVKSMLESISAKADDGSPCVAWMGTGGAGHYVKMVHNGIEYGDMQLIAETYDLLHRGAGIPNQELADIFDDWNNGELQSYLIEITSKILRRVDDKTIESLVDLILDEAAQKGTGRWTSQNSLDVGALVPTIYAALEMRLLSSLKSERIMASQLLDGNKSRFSGSRDQLIKRAGKALYASKVTSYAQGFALLKSASTEYSFGFNHADIARIWRAGCIIRAAMLDEIAGAFNEEPKLSNLMLHNLFREGYYSAAKAATEGGE